MSILLNLGYSLQLIIYDCRPGLNKIKLLFWFFLRNDKLTKLVYLSIYHQELALLYIRYLTVDLRADVKLEDT